MKVLIGQYRAVQAKILTGTIIKKGYSPFMNTETGTWWEYDDNLNAFVDTFVSILGEKGEQGEVGPKGDPGEKGDPGTGVYTWDVSETIVDGGINFVIFSDGTVLEVRNGNRGSEGPQGKPVLITSVDESQEDDAYSTVWFDDGHTLAIKNGRTGDTGPKGDKGDPAEMTQEILDELVQQISDELGRNTYLPEGWVSAPDVAVTTDEHQISAVESVGTLPSMGNDTFNAGSYTAPSMSVACDANGITKFTFNAGSYTAPSFTQGAFSPGTLPVLGTAFNVVTSVEAAASAPSFVGKRKSIIDNM